MTPSVAVPDRLLIHGHTSSTGPSVVSIVPPLSSTTHHVCPQPRGLFLWDCSNTGSLSSLAGSRSLTEHLNFQ